MWRCICLADLTWPDLQRPEVSGPLEPESQVVEHRAVYVSLCPPLRCGATVTSHFTVHPAFPCHDGLELELCAKYEQPPVSYPCQSIPPQQQEKKLSI